ncbi:hypothetical protein JXJ21_04580 [candidate division KSB1 bacterium]|nr:hypothetical protein [candidate division KSB1 bacterium]
MARQKKQTADFTDDADYKPGRHQVINLLSKISGSLIEWRYYDFELNNDAI